VPVRNELKKMATTRLAESKALINSGLFDGACYLAGYVVELALKARICKLLDIDLYPDKGKISSAYKIHDLADLIILAGLENKFKTAKHNNVNLDINWSVIASWSEQYRYSSIGTNPKERAEEIIEALVDPKDGVFIWIKKYW